MKELTLSQETVANPDGVTTLDMPAVEAMAFELDELVRANGRVYKVINIVVGQDNGTIQLWPARELPGTFLGWG
jgi:hypothetical protein